MSQKHLSIGMVVWLEEAQKALVNDSHPKTERVAALA